MGFRDSSAKLNSLFYVKTMILEIGHSLYNARIVVKRIYYKDKLNVYTRRKHVSIVRNSCGGKILELYLIINGSLRYIRIKKYKMEHILVQHTNKRRGICEDAICYMYVSPSFNSTKCIYIGRCYLNNYTLIGQMPCYVHGILLNNVLKN